ncbi:pyruvate/2-oxoglutarate dehydrogenase complex, dehydrogenase component alpha subunit [Chthonomonas calidirosea]|uniref:thiamine pyrophosphate-dependent dehydrogenase E1 component subunit alpha n=1 Tax=Chthonomonas calidirosea TaxID=454171 RepID=UPI0006DD452F|nr:thiamine pyrophosphate-dependent dehydrogenase E1 component subunit alpha [Chthonomonas calidirosea]CEK17781.1 pyruvate/2-oxoglutarate dehydrogenase complex, dehydrogenase component alpha subunit [Chthonomonas calidirosea]
MLARFYHALYRIRRVEEEIARVYPTDKIKSPCHLSIGQEAIAVAVCEALLPEDVVFMTYRGHAHYLAKGGDLNRMIAELYGKATGCAKGKGGSMHLVDAEMGIMGASAVVGTSLPQSVGYAYALKVRKANSIVASFFGDGATEEGAAHESLNFAALKRLPVLFICENNGYAIHSRRQVRQANSNLCAWASSYGIPTAKADSNDIFSLYETAQQAVEHVRRGQGPYFLECLTYRWKEHVGPGDDFHVGYRSLDELQPWLEKDPLRALAQQLEPTLRCAIETEIEQEIASAFTFAEESPWPNPSELFTDTFHEVQHGAIVNVR